MNDTPMRCADAAAYLAAFADDELAEPLRGQVAAHVAGCASCAAEVQRHEAIRGLVASLPRSAPSPEVLDRVLAASRSSGPSGIVRESLRGRKKRLASRALPDFLRAATAPPVVRPITGPARRRPRSAALGALPALAAALLIMLSVVAFSRFSSINRFGSRSLVPTPQSLAGVLQTTQRAVEGKRGGLGFSPAVPTYLPAGAAFAGVRIGAEPTDASRRYLEITWSIVLPAGTLHLRESPLPLAARSDFSPVPGDPLLTWSLGALQWSPGTLQTQELRCAVGEDRGSFSMVMDVAKQIPNLPCDDAENAKAINVLRLASLSLDAPYTPFSARPPDLAGGVLHFRASAAPDSGVSWEVWADLAHHRTSVTVRDEHGQTVYVDHISGSGVTRLDPAAHTYATLAGAASLGEPTTLPGDLIAFFNNVNAFLSAGELWALAPDPADSAHRERLVLVGAPYPTTLYVDPTSRQIVGAAVEYGASSRPGGAGASSRLTPAGGCPAFATIEFRAAGSAPASVLDFSTAGYALGQVPQTIGC